MRGFVIGDRVLLVQQKTELVDTVEQAMPGERIERELVRAAVRQRHRLRRQIDLHLGARRFSEQREQSRVSGLREHDGKQPSLHRVVAKDVGETRAYHYAKAKIEQRPRRVLA